MCALLVESFGHTDGSGHSGKEEGEGLAATCVGLDCDVVAWVGKDGGDGRGLDGRWFLDVHA